MKLIFIMSDISIPLIFIIYNQMQPQENKLNNEEVIQLMRITKKSDPLFKPLKKLKSALDNIGYDKISSQSTKLVIVFHFGLGNDLDMNFLKQTFPPENILSNNPILPGKPYSLFNFSTTQISQQFLYKFNTFNGKKGAAYTEVRYQNLSRILVFLFGIENFLKEKVIIDIQNCPRQYQENYIPGLHIKDEFITKEQQQELLRNFDEGKWQRLNNRRVQHFGYEFKYGKNQIDKEEKYENIVPKFLSYLLQKLMNLPILKGTKFDQITINDYFAGDGIPPHFDTHSPFEEYFVAVSMLSGIVMDFRKYNGQEKQVYLKERSLMIFSGQGRYAWTHGISCRKMDKIDEVLQHRSRRISITLRKIKQTPCECPYYFYCDSQGYDQEKMKKNNPLLKKYLAKEDKKKLQVLKAKEIYKKYVEQAYNSFGYNFHNKVIPEIQKLILNDLKDKMQFVLDVGCGNGQYGQFLRDKSVYFGIQRCTIMQPFQNKFHMDGLCMGFRKQVFDKIICVAVLHHLTSPQSRKQMLMQMRRILKKQGFLYLTVFNFQETQKQVYGDNQDILLQYCVPNHKVKKVEQEIVKQPCLRRQKKGQIYERYYHLFKSQEILGLVESSGYKMCELIETQKNIVVKAMGI